jgi:hypothetical protein
MRVKLGAQPGGQCKPKKQVLRKFIKSWVVAIVGSKGQHTTTTTCDFLGIN